MPGLERCADPEQMPHLEPLNPLDSEANSVHHDSSAASTPPPPFLVPYEPAKQESHRDFSQLMRDVAAPLKLSLVLENKGNVARDHLASERTYLAYVRTSLACASAGVGACVVHSCF